jgi:hypothetical protein
LIDKQSVINCTNTVSQRFDFQKALQPESAFDEFVSIKEKDIKNQLSTQSKKKPAHYFWWILLVLLLIVAVYGAVFLGYKYYISRQNTPTNVKTLSTKADPESLPGSIVSGDSFSILLDKASPNGFSLEKKLSETGFLPDKKSVVSTYSKILNDKNVGIEIAVSEYDNKFDRDTFDTQILKYIGADAELVNKNTPLKKNQLATKISLKSNQNQIYYSTVTVNNYYLIKVTRSDKAVDTEINTFVEKMITSLSLN